MVRIYFGTNTYHHAVAVDLKRNRMMTCTFKMRMDIGPGKYTVTAALHSHDTHLEDCFHWADNIASFEIAGNYDKQYIGVCKLYPEIGRECPEVIMNKETMQKISVNEIIKKISEEAAVRKAEGPRFSRQDRLHTRTSKSNHANPLKQETRLYRFAKKVQHKIRKYPFYSFAYNMSYKFKQFIPKYDASIGIGEFLQYHDEEFIKNAYQGILGREPDPQGFHLYLMKLRDGQLSKTAILGSLRYSIEGKEKKVAIRGLLSRYVIESSYRIPVIGYVLSLTMNLMRLPRIMRNIREFEAFTNARFSQQVDRHLGLSSHVHQISIDVNGIRSDVNTLSNNTQKRLDDLRSMLYDEKTGFDLT